MRLLIIAIILTISISYSQNLSTGNFEISVRPEGESVILTNSAGESQTIKGILTSLTLPPGDYKITTAKPEFPTFSQPLKIIPERTTIVDFIYTGQSINCNVRISNIAKQGSVAQVNPILLRAKSETESTADYEKRIMQIEKIIINAAGEQNPENIAKVNDIKIANISKYDSKTSSFLIKIRDKESSITVPPNDAQAFYDNFFKATVTIYEKVDANSKEGVATLIINPINGAIYLIEDSKEKDTKKCCF